MNEELVIEQLQAATNAAFALLREKRAAREDSDEWTRFPSPKGRCLISGWSRQQIARLATSGKIRRKTVGSSAFYSAADVRRMLAE